MSTYDPPDPKPPTFRTYEERKAAEERHRADKNKQTHREYRLPPVPPPGKGKHDKYQPRPTPRDPVPSAGGIPTRDMEPVKLPVAKKQDNGQFADVIPFTRDKKRD